MVDDKLNELMKELRELENEKRKSIYTGDNVIHLEYLGGLISNEDLLKLEKILQDESLQLSSYDKNGSPYMNLEDFALTIFLYISQPIILDLINGLTVNATYDCIKNSILLIHNKIINKKYIHQQGKLKEEKQVKFGIKMNTPTNGKFSFEFDGSLDSDKLDDFFDKALNVYSNSKENKSFYCVYNSEKESLSKIDVMNEIKKRNSESN